MFPNGTTVVSGIVFTSIFFTSNRLKKLIVTVFLDTISLLPIVLEACTTLLFLSFRYSPKIFPKFKFSPSNRIILLGIAVMLVTYARIINNIKINMTALIFFIKKWSPSLFLE